MNRQGSEANTSENLSNAWKRSRNHAYGSEKAFYVILRIFDWAKGKTSVEYQRGRIAGVRASSCGRGSYVGEYSIAKS